MTNRLCSILNIKTPIIAGGMIWCSGWKLASAVSNEGGLGLIGAGSMSPDILREHIKKCREATNYSFGVNIPLMSPNAPNYIDIVIEERVPVVFTSAGNPSLYTQKLKDNGIKVVHVIANEKFALKAEAAGVDAIVAEGFEAGGHNGKEETTTFVLIAQLINKVSIPIIAAGGIATGTQILAMMSLGAEGVQIGTLFAASKESSSHERFKRAIIEAKEGDTMLFFRKLSPTRLLKGGFFDKIKAAEERGATKEELLQIIGVGKTKIGIFEGNLEEGELEIGQVVSLINSVKTIKEIFEDLKREYSIAKQRMDKFSNTL